MAWMVDVGLWLARKGGWVLPAPPPIPDGPVADLQRRVQLAESKLQMRSTQLHDATDRVRHLEARVARPLAPSVTPAMMQRVHDLVAQQHGRDVSGEGKRHAVYAQLIKDFPSTPKRELAMAIEVALAEKG